ncbi:MAG: hypothetical protein ACI8ZX_000207 [Planctomycetota bacterium]|jgi:hypothetical protein
MGNSTKDILNAIQQRNLVYNSTFLYYSNQTTEGTSTTYNHPDGWIYTDSGSNAKVGYDTKYKSCTIQKSSDDSLMTFKQVISEFPRSESILSEQKVSAHAVIQNRKDTVTLPFEVVFSISDGVSTSSKSYYFDPEDKKEITIEMEVYKNPSTLKLSITSSTPNVIIYIDQIFANIGEVALSTLPCIVEGVIGERKQYIATETAPAEEFSLCNVAAELNGDYTRLNSVLNGRFGIGDNGYSMLLDMRGYFSRAWDNGANVDPNAADRSAPGTGTITGDHASTFEQDAFLKHDHGLDFSINQQIIPGDKPPAITVINTAASSKSNEDTYEGKETRPKNIYELYTIKWA